MPQSHVVDAIVNGQQITGWISGNIQCSMIVPSDSFVMRIPFQLSIWNALRRGSRMTIRADGVTLLDGFIDKRQKSKKSGVIEVSGRDRVGRLVDESAPAIDYTGMTIEEAVRRLISPWFGQLTLSNAKNRRLRRGKGRRVAAGNEPVVTVNVKVPRRGNVHPGQSRWQMIHEIVGRSGLIAYSSADGKEFFVGKPNHVQEPQYLFIAPSDDNTDKLCTVKDLTIVEDDGERFSMYLCAGTGGQGDTNYGTNVVDNRGVVFDNPFNRIDGTGRDFLFPKRMFLPERGFESFRDAERVAQNEQNRRDFSRHIATIECVGFGQNLDNTDITLFAPDTVARVIDQDTETDGKYLVVDCSFSFDRDQGDYTNMHAVPVGTEIVL